VTKISPARDDVVERAAQRKVLDCLLSPLAVQTRKLPLCPQAGLSSFRVWRRASDALRFGAGQVRDDRVASHHCPLGRRTRQSKCRVSIQCFASNASSTSFFVPRSSRRRTEWLSASCRRLRAGTPTLGRKRRGCRSCRGTSRPGNCAR